MMRSVTHARRRRRGFSLLEVMVALAILVVSLSILVETQASSAVVTREAERVITASDLAYAKLNEAMLYVEEEGFQQSQVSESGDFDSFGDDATSMDIRDELEDYHWEYTVTEIDLALAGDIAGMAGEMQNSGVLGQKPAEGAPSLASLGGGGNPLESMGVSSDMITEMLTPYIREIRVRVWWGKNSKLAEERGDEVVVVTHVVNPTGMVAAAGEGDTAVGAGGGASGSGGGR